MQKILFNRCAPIRFVHFLRKGYALYSVVGREVVVGVLSVATLSHARAEAVSLHTTADADTLSLAGVSLGEVVVTGSRAPLTQMETAKIVAVVTRDEIDRAAAASVNDILKLVTGVDVRQRGGFGVQTDIAVRGGNFDQITILLNGVNISSPQTGHHSADFPVSPDDIERVEVLEGAFERSLCGVVNIVTRSAPRSAYAHLSGGSYGYGNASAGGSLASEHFWGTLSGGYTRSDGATPNSAFAKSRTFFSGGYRSAVADVHAQLGYSYKPFEANTFYGAASTDQWESLERLMAAVSAEVRLGGVHLLPSVYRNQWYDHYQWHRHNPAGENFHNVVAQGAALSAWTESRWGKTSVGAELRHEAIWSTSLGELLSEDDWRPTGGHDATAGKYYSRHDSRRTITAFLEHNILLRRLTVSLAANAVHAPLAGWGLYPGVDVAWNVARDLRLFAAFNTALRIPTFTDLYYSGPNIEGNSHLQPEKTADMHIGLRHTRRGLTAEAQVFSSRKRHMIDWVTMPTADGQSDGIFRSVNFRMRNIGIETRLRLLPQEILSQKCPLRSVGLQYCYIHQASDYPQPILQSKYAMEYLRHRLIASADVRLWRQLGLSCSWRWQDRIGEHNPAYSLLDARLSWSQRHYTLYLDGTNILDTHYSDYITIPQPGLLLTAGVKVMF